MLQSLFSVRGRLPRPEFLALGVPLLLCTVIVEQTSMLLEPIIRGETLAWLLLRGGLIAVYLVLRIALFVATLALCARRLHDIGLSAVWAVLLLVPWAGALLLLGLVFLPGQVGNNAYGPGLYGDDEWAGPAIGEDSTRA